MRVAIIGQGYVGLTIAVGAAGAGHTIVGFDVNAGLVDQLNAGKSHIEGISDSQLTGFIAEKSFSASADPSVLEGSVLATKVPEEIKLASLESEIPSM